jgi:release factor glutamine methyltransferase
MLTAAERELDSSTSPRLDAELLLALARGCSRAALFRDRDEPVETPTRECFHALLRERLRGVPVAHLLGYREFWSMRLRVTANTLIPRPETELLVELALSLMPLGARWRVADLGTGSGAIALAIARERPSARVSATDLSRAALVVARENAARAGITNVDYIEGDWWQAVSGQHFDVVVSNPPYVAANDPHLLHDGLPYEPAMALVSGDDGMLALHTIVSGSVNHMRRGAWLLLEHGSTQGEAVRSLLSANGYRALATYRDLAGLERATIAQWRRGRG